MDDVRLRRWLVGPDGRTTAAWAAVGFGYLLVEYVLLGVQATVAEGHTLTFLVLPALVLFVVGSPVLIGVAVWLAIRYSSLLLTWWYAGVATFAVWPAICYFELAARAPLEPVPGGVFGEGCAATGVVGDAAVPMAVGGSLLFAFGLALRVLSAELLEESI